jgi:hypothetical protein
MTADELIDVLAQQALLPPNAIDTLRQFVDKSLKIVTPESLVKLLIDKRWLTPAQAKKLLSEQNIKTVAPVVDEFGLAPDDEPPVKRYTSAAKTPAATSAVAATSATAPGVAAKENTATASGSKSSVAQSNGNSAANETRLSDDLFGEPDLDDALSGSNADLLASTARRRAVIPRWVWITAAGSGVLFVLIAAALILILRSNGDSEWQLAEKDYSSGANRPAVAKLDAFLEQFPNHPRAPTARVYRGVARLRLACAAKTNWETALAIANEELPRIVDLPDFTNVRDGLAKLLPELAVGLAADAKQGVKGSLDRRRREVDAALSGLALAKDPRYTPDSQRPWALLQTTEDEVALLARAVDRESELEQAAGEIRSALAAKQVTAAVARREKLLTDFPELDQDLTVEALNHELADAGAASVIPDNHPPQSR